MANDGSVAPKERVNLVYKPAIGDAQEEKELPFRMAVLGDFTQRQDDTPLEDRKPISIDKDNFNDVLKNQELSVAMNVPDRLSGEEDGELTAKLSFDSINDFRPENVVNQVPELKKLLELRTALTALKGPLGNVPHFRKAIQSMLGDDASREKLLKELNIGNS